MEPTGGWEVFILRVSNVTAGPGKGEGGRVDLFDGIKFFLQVWDPLIIIEERLIGVNIGL